MTAVRIPIEAIDATPDDAASTAAPVNGRVAAWVDVATAATRMGISPQRVGQLCVTKWIHAGLARKVKGVWQVSVNADVRLVNFRQWDRRDARQFAEMRLEGVRPDDIERAEAIRDILCHYAAFRPRGAGDPIVEFQAAMIARGIVGAGCRIKRIRKRTLETWQSNYRRGGLRALAPKFTKRGRCGASIGEAALAFFREQILSGNDRPVTEAHTLTLGEAERHPLDSGWDWPTSYKAALKLASERISLPERILANKGIRQFNADCLPKMIRNKPPAGVEWCGDVRTLDLMCRVPFGRGQWRKRRPKFTAWIDMRSSLFIGWILADYADSNTILGSLKRGIQAHGKPQRLRVDWGKDYQKALGHTHKGDGWTFREFDGERVEGVVGRLGITVHPVGPYTPWAKPIERIFKEVKDKFDRLFPSFIGGSPAERHGDRHKEIAEDIGSLPPIDEVAEVLAQYIEQFNATVSGGADMFGLSPAEVFDKYRDENWPPTFESDDVLNLLFLDYVGPLTVHRDGVRYHSRWFSSADMQHVPMMGKRVMLALDPADLGAAYVCDPKTQKPLFEVHCSALAGVNKNMEKRLREARGRTRRKIAKAVRESQEATFVHSPTELLDRRAAGLKKLGKLRAAPTPSTPASITLRPDIEADVAAVPPLTPGLPGGRRGDRDDSPIDLADLMPVPTIEAPAAADDPDDLNGTEWFLEAAAG